MPPPAPLVDHAPAGPVRLVADRDRALLEVEGVGRFAVESGRRIVVEAAPDADPHALEMWLHGSVAALLLAQQRRFALHASVVDVDGVAVAISGRSGAGKTTTSLALGRRGHALLNDDVSPIEIDPPVARLHPWERPLHVWPATAGRLGVELEGGRPILPGYEKLAFDHRPGAPVALGAVVVLRPAGAGEIEVTRFTGARAVRLLGRHVYRVRLLEPLWQHELFAWAAGVAANAQLHRLVRPAETWTADAVCDEIERIAADVRG